MYETKKKKLLSLISCNSDDKKTDDNSIIGTWKLIEIYGNNGTESNWTTVNDGYSYTINIDNIVSSRNYSCIGEFSINEELEYSLFINFDCQNITFNGNYKFEIEDEQLILYWNPINCDERCAEKYTKIVDE